MDFSSNMTAFQQAAGQVISRNTYAARGLAFGSHFTLTSNAWLQVCVLDISICLKYRSRAMRRQSRQPPTRHGASMLRTQRPESYDSTPQGIKLMREAD